MKKILTIALLASLSAMFVAGFVSTLGTQQAYAQTASIGVFADDETVSGTGSGSSTGRSGSSAGFTALCEHFGTTFGSCSESRG